MPTHFLLPAFLAAAAAATASGCGGASLGTVPRAANAPLESPAARPVVVHMHGRTHGTARLRAADDGQKTSLGLVLRRGVARPLTAAVAQGSCTRPRALTSVTVLGRVEQQRTSWTLPTPWAQLRATHFVVVLRSPDRAVTACGAG